MASVESDPLSSTGQASTSVTDEQPSTSPLAANPSLRSVAEHETLPDVAPSSSADGGTVDVPDTIVKDVKTQFISPHAADPTPPVPLPRSRRRLNAPAPKSILKPPSAAPTRFSWKRDFLQPVSSRLAYAAANASGSVPSAESQAAAGAVGLNAQTVTGTSAALGNAAAGFWGSALKKLSGVTAAAAGAAPSVERRHLDGDAQVRLPSEPVDIGHSAAKREGVAAASSPSSSSAEHLHRPGSLDGPAPHTPAARGSATSSLASSSPYATIKSTAHPQPQPPPPPPLSISELKRVRFRVGSIKVVYPINGPDGPIAPYEEGKTRKRINAEQRAKLNTLREGGESRGWTGESLLRLYGECCRTREERSLDRVRKTLRDNMGAPPKVLDLSNELLSHGAVEALSDLLSVDFGLRKLVLENCGLDDESLRPLLHALLVSGNIPTISLANNKRIKSKGWKFIAVFLRKAHFLRYLDVSENNIDKRAADYIVQALTPQAPPLSSPDVEPPADFDDPRDGNTAVNPDKGSTDPSPTSAEDDDDADADDSLEPLFSSAPLLKMDNDAPGASSVPSIRLENCNLRGAALEALAHGVRASSLKHISIRRNRIGALGAVSLAVMIRDYPLTKEPADLENGFAPSPTPATVDHVQPTQVSNNSVTARQLLHAPSLNRAPSSTTSARSRSPARSESGTVDAALKEDYGVSEAKTLLRRQIAELPRTGSLLTLDVKANDIRSGVSYIAQVLKRNRTLKVLNLSENKIDSLGLLAIAEALKLNTTLETLDMSLNPCCGPGLDGIFSLRSAITVNSNIKRVFLNSTDLTSEGAIALAEFVPEAKSLLHLDLTGNFEIDIAGALALSVSVKMNTTLRCLDLNIPPNDSDFARLSQEILQCCIRNTEQAQEEAASGGKKISIAAPILKSTVARDLKELHDAEERQARARERTAKNKEEIFSAAEEIRDVLSDMLKLDEEAKRKGVIVAPSEIVRDTLVSAQLADAQLAEAVAASRHGTQKDRAIVLGDELTALLDRAKAVYDASTPSPSTPRPVTNGSQTLSAPASSAPTSPAEAPSSPGFTIVDSDDEESDGSKSSTANSASKGKMPPLEIPASAVAVPADPDEEEPLRSPMGNQSRCLTLEEGEVFRKGAALGTAEVEDDDEDGKGEVSGEELKKEILETKVERSPRTSFSTDASRPLIERD